MKQTKFLLSVILDSLIVVSAIYVAYIVVYAEKSVANPLGVFHTGNLLQTAMVLLAFHYVYSYIYKLYIRVWEYASIDEMIAIIKTVTLSAISTALLQMLISGEIFVRVIGIAWMAHLLLIGGSRFIWRLSKQQFNKAESETKNAIIIGAGSAGVMLSQQLKNAPGELKPVAFFDDDIDKKNMTIAGIRVFGEISQVESYTKENKVDRIVIAIPSANKDKLTRVLNECLKTGIKTVIMPKAEDIISGKVSISNFRDVDVEDLLGRDPVQLDTQSISEKIKGKTVLVSGAGGSIGSELCRQICEFQPEKLILLGHGENSIYHIDMELRNRKHNVAQIIPVIADVQDRKRIFEVLNQYRPDVVLHAAAHKHVPMMELNPKEAVKNNVNGTQNMAEGADQFGVKTFILISTDKAVNPTNVMGSTKRLAEMIIQKLAKTSKTEFVAVRFGNVLGSRGSVIPLFKQQILSGGPVKVTDPEITRYFMTIPEAARLVLQAGSLANGGEIFVLDMGEPVKIVDLAKNLIRLSGSSLEDIKIEFTGLRPGEKMYEELLNDSEIMGEAVYPKIFVGRTNLAGEEMIEPLLKNLEEMSEEEVQKYVLNVANSKLEAPMNAQSK